jgi:glycosyl transferase family 25
VRTEILVINLAHDTDRREAFTRQASAAGVSWNFFQACTALAPGLAYDPADSLRACGRPLTTGELGCYSSHFSVWQKLQTSDWDQLIVMEDDLLVDWAFIRLMVGRDFAAQGINYLRLFSRLIPPFRHIRWRYLDDSRRLIRYLDYAYGTQAYLITRKGAATMARHCQRVCRPIDHEMDRFWSHGVPDLAVYPPPVVEISAPSRIGGGRYEGASVARAVLRRHAASWLMEKARRKWARFSPNPRLTL